MIRTFRDKETEKIYNQKYSKALPSNMQKLALRKLMMIEASEKLNDLEVPPGNHLERLYGDRDGQYSIRINDKYRICFYFDSGDFYDVEITDYH